MSDPLPEALRTLRMHWHVDLQTTREALDRMDIPQPPEIIRSLDRLSEDDEPAPSLVWRLAWLEGPRPTSRSRRPITTNSARWPMPSQPIGGSHDPR